VNDGFGLLPPSATPATDGEPDGPPVLRAELEARRAVQRERAEHARLGEADQGCPECGPANPVTQLAGEVPGWVPILVDIPVDAAGYPEPYTQVQRRPCFTCNRARWEAWQAGDMAGTRSSKRPADTQAADRERLR
jgi:hypothetical protein